MKKWILFATAFALAIPLSARQEVQDTPAQPDTDLKVREDLKAGLCAQYFNVGHEIKKFPTPVEGQKAQVCRVESQINFEAKDGAGFRDLQWKEYFAAVWTGSLRAPKTGKYTFYLKSDDGSKLFLDGKLVVDNDGKHRLDEDSKSLDLTAGDHDFKVEYFQNKDKAGCVLSWKYEGTDKQVVPASAFWHKYDKDVDAK